MKMFTLNIHDALAIARGLYALRRATTQFQRAVCQAEAAIAGRMFWLTEKKFVGSYFALIAASRS